MGNFCEISGKAAVCSGVSLAGQLARKYKRFETDHKLANEISLHVNEAVTRGLIRKLLNKSGQAKFHFCTITSFEVTSGWLYMQGLEAAIYLI